jgi:hypothetical protein
MILAGADFLLIFANYSDTSLPYFGSMFPHPAAVTAVASALLSPQTGDGPSVRGCVTIFYSPILGRGDERAKRFVVCCFDRRLAGTSVMAATQAGSPNLTQEGLLS